MAEDKALEHQTRKLVYNYIKRHPGATATTLQEVFELAEGTLRYHLHYLEKHNIVTSTTKGKFRCYTAIKRPRAAATRPVEINMDALTEVQRQLATVIEQNPGINIAELEKKTKVDRKVLQYNLKVLRDRMIVWKVGNGRSTKYEFTSGERVRKELFKLLLAKFIKGEVDEKTYPQLKGQLEREGLEE